MEQEWVVAGLRRSESNGGEQQQVAAQVIERTDGCFSQAPCRSGKAGGACTASLSSSNQTNPKPGGFRATHASLRVPKPRKKSRRSLLSAWAGRFPTNT
eukprot:759030-Hanusia_phi.AAC.3